MTNDQAQGYGPRARAMTPLLGHPYSHMGIRETRVIFSEGLWLVWHPANGRGVYCNTHLFYRGPNYTMFFV